MNPQLKTPIEDYKKTEWEKLLRGDLGEHNLKALKPDLDLIKNFIDDLIESDKEIANAILLELTKSMFRPQDTGFVKNQSDASSGSKIVEISKSIFGNSKN